MMRTDVDLELQKSIHDISISIRNIALKYFNKDAWNPDYCPIKEDHEYLTGVLTGGMKRCPFCEMEFD